MRREQTHELKVIYFLPGEMSVAPDCMPKKNTHT